MRIKSFTVNPFSENTYLIIEDGSALLVDPGFYKQSEYSACKKILDDVKAELHGIILTHAHVDHILGIQRVRQDYEVPVYLNHENLYLWDNVSSQALMFGLQVDGFDFKPEELPVQKNWEIGPFSFDVLFTPGHSPEHVSLYSREYDVLIAGDTLFKESIGRTDLYQGDMETLKASIQEKIYVLPDQTQVLPGHGPATTVGHEKIYNQIVKAKEGA